MFWYLVRTSQLDQDANDDSEYATFNLFLWYRYNEDGLWLADAQGDVGMTRKRNWHQWISYESDESDEELGCDDAETIKDVDLDGIIRWRDAISSPLLPESIDSRRDTLTPSQGHP